MKSKKKKAIEVLTIQFNKIDGLDKSSTEDWRSWVNQTYNYIKEYLGENEFTNTLKIFHFSKYDTDDKTEIFDNNKPQIAKNLIQYYIQTIEQTGVITNYEELEKKAGVWGTFLSRIGWGGLKLYIGYALYVHYFI